MQTLYLKIDWQAMPACVARIQLDRQPHGWLFTPQTADGRAISGIDTESAAVRALSFKGEPAPDYFQLGEGLKWLNIRRPITMPNAAEELAKLKQKHHRHRMKLEMHVHQNPLDGRWCWEVVNSGTRGRRNGLLTVAKSPTSAYATKAAARRGFHRFRDHCRSDKHI